MMDELVKIGKELGILIKELEELPRDANLRHHRKYTFGMFVSSLQVEDGVIQVDNFFSNFCVRGGTTLFEKDCEQYDFLIDERSQVLEKSRQKLLLMVEEELKRIDSIEKEIERLNKNAVDYARERHRKLEERISCLTTNMNELKLTKSPWINEKIDKYGLSWVFDRRELPNEKGVYLLVSANGLDYIGQSNNLKRRISKTHHIFDGNKQWVGFIKIEGRKERLELERHLISLLKPKYNKQYSYLKNQMMIWELGEMVDVV